MNQNEINIVKNFFSAYYANAQFNIPSIEKREFGVGFEKKIDARHLSFDSLSQLRNYLINNTPFFISYSTAYYDLPAVTPIENKGWLGADLVFDLDMHSTGKYDVYPLLGKVKEDAIKLSEEFLQSDFGLKKSEITYVFSGNRGYHIHVRSNDTFSLGSNERREIVDYIRGVGLDVLGFFTEDEHKGIKGPSAKDSGYKGRFARKFVEELKKNPTKFYRSFSNPEKLGHFLDGISEGNWSRTPFSLEKLYAKIEPISAMLPLMCVDADAGVTYDVKKLIRLPNSIHGETGFIAREIKDIDSFEPLSDALINTKEPIQIEFTEDVSKIEIAHSAYSFNKGEKKELPISIGLFFLLKGSAKIASK